VYIRFASFDMRTFTIIFSLLASSQLLSPLVSACGLIQTVPKFPTSISGVQAPLQGCGHGNFARDQYAAFLAEGCSVEQHERKSGEGPLYSMPDLCDDTGSLCERRVRYHVDLTAEELEMVRNDDCVELVECSHHVGDTPA